MKKLMILLVFTVFLLSGCGESHTYSGVLKRTGLGGAEGKVNITIKKQSEKEATMTIARDGNDVPGLFLADCTAPIKLKQDEFQGKTYWSPDTCYLKDDSKRLVGNAGEFQVEGKQLTMKITSEYATERETKFEFTGTEK